MASREEMVREIRQVYGLDDERIFDAMLKVPREKFAPREYRFLAYKDSAIPIGHDQTMSQPYTVAYMTHLLDLEGDGKVLEIGTGSGYQAAVLSKLANKVYTVEIIKELAEKARKKLKELGYKNVKVKVVKEEIGWEEHAPYDAIIVTAAIRHKVPQVLFNQLKEKGVLVAPVEKDHEQIMTKFTKERGKIEKEEHGVFVFVPFIEELS
jgi:protein-L-isoaspartate(D-aspartate) O-methyltransferase